MVSARGFDPRYACSTQAGPAKMVAYSRGRRGCTANALGV